VVGQEWDGVDLQFDIGEKDRTRLRYAEGGAHNAHVNLARLRPLVEFSRSNRALALGNSRTDHFGGRKPVANQTIQIGARIHESPSTHSATPLPNKCRTHFGWF